jgi:putative nucleotidyltransferase with HDIG domain
MSLPRLVYRSEQFRKYLGFRSAPPKLSEAQQVLTPAQLSLFLRMQPGEQAHSLEVLRRLREQGEMDPDLLTAALLHDVGKVRFPLRLWERVWIVLAGVLLPGRFKTWGETPSEPEEKAWWERLAMVAAQHPAWGAELAQEAGCSPRAVSLIRRHQDHAPLDLQNEENRLLARLQAVDERS